MFTNPENGKTRIVICLLAAFVMIGLLVFVSTEGRPEALAPVSTDKFTFTELSSGENYRIIKHDQTGVVYAVSEDGVFTPLVNASGRPLFKDRN